MKNHDALKGFQVREFLTRTIQPLTDHAFVIMANLVNLHFALLTTQAGQEILKPFIVLLHRIMKMKDRHHLPAYSTRSAAYYDHFVLFVPKFKASRNGNVNTAIVVLGFKQALRA
ncbi:hypothetical protein ACFL12_02630 [Pseudomonadota bacterium]